MGAARFAVGDIYEDCAYHPVRCEYVDDEEILGVSLIDGSRPRGCDLNHCGVIKLTEAEAQQRVEAFRTNGERGLLRHAGLSEAQIDEAIATRSERLTTKTRTS